MAYYPMDIHNQYLLDRSGNDHHGIMIGPIVRSRYFSDDCPEPDGSMDCPYPTIESALEDVQAWDRILLRQGRYTEFIMRDGINHEGDYVWAQLDPDFEGPKTNTITIEPYLNENVIIDGTVSIDVDWEPYSHNGHSIFRATLDSAAIANEIQRPFRTYTEYGSMTGIRYLQFIQILKIQQILLMAVQMIMCRAHTGKLMLYSQICDTERGMKCPLIVSTV